MNIRRTLFLLFAVIIPFLLFGQKDIEFDEIWGVEIRNPHYSIPIKAYVEEENHDLIITVLDNCNPLYLQIKDYKGSVLYCAVMTSAIMEDYVISLGTFPFGKYEVMISDGNISMVGKFSL